MYQTMNTFKMYLSVGVGGILGSIGRYLVAEMFPTMHTLPIATLIVNLTGCFLLSFLLFSLMIKRRFKPWVFTGLTTGVIGSFTTFSTVIVELYDLSQKDLFLTIFYCFVSLFGGLLCCYFGYSLAKSSDSYG